MLIVSKEKVTGIMIGSCFYFSIALSVSIRRIEIKTHHCVYVRLCCRLPCQNNNSIDLITTAFIIAYNCGVDHVKQRDQSIDNIIIACAFFVEAL